jgi:hypothetical protein
VEVWRGDKEAGNPDRAKSWPTYVKKR